MKVGCYPTVRSLREIPSSARPACALVPTRVTHSPMATTTTSRGGAVTTGTAVAAANGAKVVRWPRTGATNQQFQFIGAGY